MSEDIDVRGVAAALRVSIGLLLRRMRQARVEGELTVPETSALARLDRSGPATSSALAKLEQISPQSMGATLSALEARGLVGRGPDAQDGRRVVLSVTEAATVLGISRALAYELVGRGELPALHLGRRLVVPKAALLELLGLAGPRGL